MFKYSSYNRLVIYFFLDLLFWLNLISCGSSESKSKLQSHTGYYSPELAQPSDNIKSLLENIKLSCDLKDGNCPKNIGIVALQFTSSISKNENKILRQCTGALIGNDLVITNSHCIPVELKKDPSLCSESLGFKLAQKNKNFPIYSECEKLLYYSEINDSEETIDLINPHVAIFKLKTTLTSEPFKIDTTGINDAEILYSYSVDPDSETEIKGIIRKKTCFAVQNTSIVPKFIHPFAKVAALFGSDCTIIPGNSGSPLLSDESSLKGLLSHGKKPIKQLIDATQNNVHFGLASNLACLSVSNLDHFEFLQNGKCSDSYTNEVSNKISEDFQNSIKKETLLKINSYYNNFPEFKFIFSSQHLNPEMPEMHYLKNYFSKNIHQDKKVIKTIYSLLTPQPYCMQSQTTLENHPRQLNSNIGIPKNHLYLNNLIQPLVKLTLFFDAYSRLKYLIEIKNTQSKNAEINFSKIGTDRLAGEVLSHSGIKDSNNQFKVKWCDKTDNENPLQVLDIK